VQVLLHHGSAVAILPRALSCALSLCLSIVASTATATSSGADAPTSTSSIAEVITEEVPVVTSTIVAEVEDEARSGLEIGILPAINFDSDTGFGFGVIANLAMFEPEHRLHRWRVTAQGYASVKDGPKGAEFPLQHHYIKLDMPDSLTDGLRLRVVGRFRRQVNVGYFGVGNATEETVSADVFDPELEPDEHLRAFRFYQYDRIYPELKANVQFRLLEGVEVFGGLGVTWNWITAYPGSKLQMDAAQVVGVGRHGLIDAQVGLLYDTRDEETSPQSGMFHEISLRGGKLVERSEAFGGANATFRIYQAIFDEYLAVAARLMADLLFGDAPVYELANHGGLFPTTAIAGGEAIRGLPGQRYHGKIKLLGNVELRSKLVDFTLFEQDFNLGLIAFFDTGRVWADYKANELFDGTGVGLKYGVGGGLRIQWGQTFVIRGDVGWSPDGLGIYININHIF